jgi:16S rRNA (guanine1207-N2)-methyltransferase
VLVAIPKQVEESKYLIASALYALKTGGNLLLAAANDANGNRLEKWLKEIGLDGESLSKNKARSVWTTRPATLPPLVQDWHMHGRIKTYKIGDGLQFSTQPGLFGWDKIDLGSKVLADFLPPTLKGAGADFGAGTGYLSYRLLQQCPAVSTLFVAEADARALFCAKINLENVRNGRTLEFVWADLTKQADVPKLDFIVMNPPFHIGKKTDAALGQAFLDTAARALKKGGTLYLVANVHLPYEQILAEKFARVRTLVTEQGFKVIKAVI